jgi:hypothetical protein
MAKRISDKDKEPATEKQLAALGRLGYNGSKRINKAMARSLIYKLRFFSTPAPNYTQAPEKD